MNRPLFECTDHIRYLCAQLDIDAPVWRLTRVPGGFHNTIWRLQAGERLFAVKQLAGDIDLHDPDVAAHYNRTEAIAEAFSRRGLPAIHAIRRGQSYLRLVDNTGYLVYPWCDGTASTEAPATVEQACDIARLLAKMHRAGIDFPDAGAQEFVVLPDAVIVAQLDRAMRSNILHATALSRELPVFLSIAASHRAAVPVLKKQLVISHGDLDAKNVLWDAAGKPQLIDWESAGTLNPTYEIVMAALDWSRRGSDYDRPLSGKILIAYREAGGQIDAAALESAFHCVLGEWLIWLVYNIARAMEPDQDQHRRGAAQIELVLPTLLRLKDMMPGLLSFWRSRVGV